MIGVPRTRLGFALDHRWVPGRMSRYLDDQLGTILRRRLAHHLSECQECRALLASLQHLLGVLGRAAQAGADEPAPPLAAAVRARLHEHEHEHEHE